jgi:hypothetical protein
MRSITTLALLSTTALVGPAAAQVQPQQQQQKQQQEALPGQATATAASCERLVSLIQERQKQGASEQQAGVTLTQARQWQQQQNFQACADHEQRLRTAEGQSGSSQIVVQQQPPQVTFDQAAPRITVQQPQPQVSVTQPVPEIIVQQAPPTITVQQPQPQITVRMPQPQVSISMPEPQVSVQSPEPQVRVTQPQAQPQVQVERAQPQIVVQPPGEIRPTIQQSGQAPIVRYEQQGEPRIVYQRSEGQPQIRIERLDAEQQGQPRQETTRAPEQRQEQSALQQQSAQQQAAAPQQQQGASPTIRTMRVADVIDTRIYGAQGALLGDVDRIVVGPDNRQYVLVGRGGFLGIGERLVPVALESLVWQNNRLVTTAMSTLEADRTSSFRSDQVRDVGRDVTLQVPIR